MITKTLAETAGKDRTMSLRELLTEKRDLEERIEKFDFDWQGDRHACDMLEEHVKEYSEPVIVFGMLYEAIDILREVDSVAYREIMNDEIDNLLDDREDNEGILRSLFLEYDRMLDELADIETSISERIDHANIEPDNQGRHPKYPHLLYGEIDIADDAPGMYRFTSQAFPGKSAILTEEELDVVDLDYEYIPFGYVDIDTVETILGIED